MLRPPSYGCNGDGNTGEGSSGVVVIIRRNSHRYHLSLKHLSLIQKALIKINILSYKNIQ